MAKFLSETLYPKPRAATPVQKMDTDARYATERKVTEQLVQDWEQEKGKLSCRWILGSSNSKRAEK